MRGASATPPKEIGNRRGKKVRDWNQKWLIEIIFGPSFGLCVGNEMPIETLPRIILPAKLVPNWSVSPWDPAANADRFRSARR